MRVPRLLALLATVMVVSAAPGLAYTIYLRDGSQIIAKEKYRIQGDRAIMVLSSGATTSLPLSEIDVKKTEATNQVDYGDVVVIDQQTGSSLAGAARPPQRDENPRLTQVAGPLGTRLERPGPGAAATGTGTAGMPRTAGGNFDFLRMTRNPYPSMDLGTQLSQLLRSRGLENVAIYEGTTADRVFLEFSTNSEATVFRALEASCEVMMVLRDQGVRQVGALELFMATDRRQRAGQFLITPERAEELVSRRLDTPQFFIKYVEF